MRVGSHSEGGWRPSRVSESKQHEQSGENLEEERDGCPLSEELSSKELGVTDETDREGVRALSPLSSTSVS